MGRIFIVALVLAVPFGIYMAAQADKKAQKSDGVGVRFNMPKCHRNVDGSWECFLKKLDR